MGNIDKEMTLLNGNYPVRTGNDGWNKEIIFLEHTIRPEGYYSIIYFIAGTVFYLLQKLARKSCLRTIQFGFISALMFLTQPKFILGGLFIIVYATYYSLNPGP